MTSKFIVAAGVGAIALSLGPLVQRAVGGDKTLHSDLVARLQKVMPKGWKVDTAKLHAPNIQPMGRTPGLGSEIRLVHRSNPQAGHPDVRAVVWVMNKPSAPDPQSTDNLADSLGEGRLGHVYLLTARGIDNPANYWTEYQGDIAVAMGAARRPSGTEQDVAWGTPTNGLQAGIRINALIENSTRRLLLTLSVRNVGTKPVRLLRLETQKRFWCHVPVEVKVEGKVLPYRGLVIEPPPPANIKEFIDPAPGVVDSTEVQMLAADWHLQNLQGAEVTFVYANEQATTIAHPFNEDTRKYTEVAGLWTGTARSGTVTLDDTEIEEKSAPQAAVPSDSDRLPIKLRAQPGTASEENRPSTTQEAARLAKIRDRFLQAAKATRELRGRAVVQEEKTLQQWGMHLDHSQRIFPKAEDVLAYEKIRPWAQYYCYNRWERAFAVESSPPVISDAPALRRLLDDPDPDVRSLAIEALGALHQPEDVGRIGRYLTDEKETVATLDWAVQLSSFNPPVFLERMNIRSQRHRPLQHWHHSDRYWYDMKVRDYAVRSLHLMTGFVFDAKGFPAWWDVNKDGRNCLWYWQQRFQREWDGFVIRRPNKSDASTSVTWEELLKVRERGADLLRARLLQETRHLSPEVEAKVLLLARRRSGAPFCNRFFDLPLSLRLEPERLLDYAERKTSWPDVDWDRPGGRGSLAPYDEPWWQKDDSTSGDSLYGTMIDRLGRSAERLFKPEHLPRLRGLLGKYRSTGLMLGISRMLPRADADNLDDPVSRDGFLRSIVRGEDGVFVRGSVAAELVRVSLADNWTFLKKTVFTEPPVPHYPDVRQLIIRALAEPPLTILKRQKLTDLLLDPRFKAMLAAEDERFRRDTQQAVNAHAGEELMSDELVRRLGDAETATEAWEQFIQKIKRLDGDTGDRLPEDLEKNLGETPTSSGDGDHTAVTSPAPPPNDQPAIAGPGDQAKRASIEFLSEGLFQGGRQELVQPKPGRGLSMHGVLWNARKYRESPPSNEFVICHLDRRPYRRQAFELTPPIRVLPETSPDDAPDRSAYLGPYFIDGQYKQVENALGKTLGGMDDALAPLRWKKVPRNKVIEKLCQQELNRNWSAIIEHRWKPSPIEVRPRESRPIITLAGSLHSLKRISPELAHIDIDGSRRLYRCASGKRDVPGAHAEAAVDVFCLTDNREPRVLKIYATRIVYALE